MENDFNGTNRTGFSHMPENPEFIEEMRQQIKKNFKYAIISAPVIFIIIIAITATVALKQGSSVGEILLVASVLLVIFTGIAFGMWISLLKDLGRLKKDAVDGTVIKNKKWHSLSDEKKSNKKKYLIVIRSDEGKKIKIKDKKAMAFHPYVNEGDKVRYHPGYPFPIEIYDKSKCGTNICVFCGAQNTLSDSKCQRCGKPVLM